MVDLTIRVKLNFIIIMPMPIIKVILIRSVLSIVIIIIKLKTI